MYRKKALESRVKGFSNPVTIRGSLSVHLMLSGIFVVSFGLLIFGLLTDYTRRSTVNGFLSPESGSVSVTAIRAGQLFIEVPNGASVSFGDKIAKIVGYDVDASGNLLLDLEIQGLEEAKSLAKKRLELTRSKLEPLEKQEELALAQHQREITAAKTLITSHQAHLDIVDKEMMRSESLVERGLLASAALQNIQQRLITARQSLDDAEAKLESLEAQTDQLNIDWRMRGVELRQEINALERDQRTLEGQITKAKAQRESGIFAPENGIVTYSTAQNGEVVNVGTPLFQLTPTDIDLQAILFAPSSAIGFVDIGDTVQIRYSAFSYREHGVFAGTVLSIDDTAQLPNTIRAPIQTSEPVYRVHINIDQHPKSKSGDQLRLVSGMTLEASIIIDQKPLLFWLFDPIF